MEDQQGDKTELIIAQTRLETQFSSMDAFRALPTTEQDGKAYYELPLGLVPLDQLWRKEDGHVIPDISPIVGPLAEILGLNTDEILLRAGQWAKIESCAIPASVIDALAPDQEEAFLQALHDMLRWPAQRQIWQDELTEYFQIENTGTTPESLWPVSYEASEGGEFTVVMSHEIEEGQAEEASKNFESLITQLNKTIKAPEDDPFFSGTHQYKAPYMHYSISMKPDEAMQDFLDHAEVDTCIRMIQDFNRSNGITSHTIEATFEVIKEEER